MEEDPINNPVQYGAVGEKSTDNMLKIIFDVFLRMWRQVMAVKGIKSKMAVLIAPPEESIEKDIA